MLKSPLRISITNQSAQNYIVTHPIARRAAMTGLSGDLVNKIHIYIY